MTKLGIPKRILLMFLVAWITFMSVFSAYKQTTYCAEWVAGVIATVGGAPLLTALAIGGVVVAGGIAIYEISQTDADDYRDFYNGIKRGFQEFVSDQEKQIALEQDSSLSDQEASDIGVAVAREKVNGFFKDAIDTTTGVAQNLQYDAVKYWDLYSRIISGVADNGLESDGNGDFNSSTVFRPTVFNLAGISLSGVLKENIGSNCIEYQGNWYTLSGYWQGVNHGPLLIGAQDYSDSFTIPFSLYKINYPYDDTGNRHDQTCYCRATINKSTGLCTEIVQYDKAFIGGEFDNYYQQFMSNTSIPLYVVNANEVDSILINIRDNWKTALKVNSIGSGDEVNPQWKRTIKNTLDNTHIGNSIQTGRKQLVNEGDWIGSIFKEDSVPVRKTGVMVNEGVVTGQLGWDIPLGSTWDDWVNGKKGFGDVVGDTGTVGVPDSALEDPQAKDTSVSYPEDTPVQDTADYPKEGTGEDEGEGEKPQEIPEKPQTDVFEDQGGSYYPSAMDLTNIFPFCIPFDIIYLVQKFDVGGEQAPVITIPIVYPSAIASAMGSDSYEVVIDFQDYITVRNVIRVFLLLLFVVGLLKITRDLIRG